MLIVLYIVKGETLENKGDKDWITAMSYIYIRMVYYRR